jgi:hypothetical protein
MVQRIVLASALLPALALAQGFTSPAGYVTVEGSSNHDYILFKYDDMRWQQLDQTSVGQGLQVVQRVSWRRDGTSGVDPTWAARTMDIQVVLSNAVMPGAVSEDFDANYSGAPTVVFTMKSVNLPDWTQPPASVPAPFDLNLQLDTPWAYTALEPFLWEVRTKNNTSGSDYGNDFQSMSGGTGSSNLGTAIGTGCVATGRTAAMSLGATIKNQFTRFRLAYTLTNGPSSALAVANVDIVNSNLSPPGLCGTLVALPTLAVPLGTTDPAGAASTSIENIPFAANLIGKTIYSQGLAIDLGQPGIPVALSNGRSNVFPTTPATPATVTRVYGYRLTSGSMRAPSVWTGGIIALFD